MRLLLLSLVALLVCMVIGTGAYGWSQIKPVSSDATETSFVIRKGESLTQVAQRLESDKIIRSATALRLIAKLQDSELKIFPGTYTVSASMNPSEVLVALLTEPEDVWVTLLEGWRMEEMADELASKLTEKFDKEEFLTLAKAKEGTLFPDTYLFPKDVTAPIVISTLENTFKKRYMTVIEEVGGTARLQDEVLILASLLEREARDPVEMKVVAGILENRLRIGMPLQVDATLQYIRGYDKSLQTWWPEPRAIDKELESPYNTYKNRGLPPGPISNPGKAALIAASRPDTTDFLFYISDRQGNMHYAKDLPGHNANVQKYLR